jgi:hypothetical protein
MAATTNSTYQKILVKHISNNPPNAYPQTANENFSSYYNRMQNQGLNPDIGSTESDSDYLARLATYNPVPYSNISASYATTAISAITASYISGSTQMVNISAGVSMSFSNGIFQYLTV